MSTDTAEVVRIGGLTLRFLAAGDPTNPSATVFEMTVAPGSFVPPPHSHLEGDELIVGLSGTLTTTVDGQERRLGPGQSSFCPAGSVHHFRNDGAEPAVSLVTITPGRISASYFREAAALAAGGRPDPAALRDLMDRYGLVPA